MKDILLDENMDIVFTSEGGIALGDSDEQNIELIIISEKGEWKEKPLLGVGVRKYLKSTGRKQQLKREISVQLQYDGYSADKVDIDDNGNLKIEI